MKDKLRCPFFCCSLKQSVKFIIALTLFITCFNAMLHGNNDSILPSTDSMTREYLERVEKNNEVVIENPVN